MPLGLCDEVDYTESEYKIEPGDTIVLYTDGIPEAENATDEFYQMERFTKLLQSIAPKGLHVNEIGREIRESVHDFSGDREPNDDSTYMVIRYKKSAE